MAMLFVPLAVPLAGALGYAVFGWRRATRWIGVGSSALLLAVAITLAVSVVRSGPEAGLDGLLWLDGVSVFMLLVIGSVAVLATAATPAHFREEIVRGRASTRTAARHSALVQVFVATMNLAVLAANLGVLWVAIEATTIVTAVLVGQRRTRSALEAAWKYVMICSAGIALALLGTFLLNFASSAGAPGHDGGAGLDFAVLVDTAPVLDPGVTRIAVVLLVLGFGTKAGLAPLHAWLPDAYSQAPAPVTALMSGVLVSVGVYAILRVKVISDAALGAGFLRTVLTVMALASLAVAASLLLAQRDYKRMLAYSSIEHLGLVALGTAIGSPLAIAAVLLHLLGHGLTKAVLFVSAGRIEQLTGSTRIDQVRGLAVRAPVLAAGAGLAIAALIGLPPFSLFASEIGIARAGLTDPDLRWATAAALALVLVAAAALITHTSRMLLGARVVAPGAAAAPASVAGSTTAVLIAGLAACAVLGLAAGPLTSLLELAADTLVGQP